MRHDRIAKAVAVLLLVSLNASLLLAQSAVIYPQSQPGVVFPDAGVMVRNNPVYYTVAVFPGDRVQTGATPTLLTWEGASLTLQPSTWLVFGKVIEVGCGGLTASINPTITLRVNGTDVVPTTETAKIEVINAAGTVRISMLSGNASLTSTERKSVLAEGQSTFLPGTHDCGVMTPTPTPGGNGTPTAAGQAKSRKLLWGLLGGAAAGGVVAGVLASRGERPVSPSVP